MSEIAESRIMFAAYSNTDLTEGRGREYAKYVCELRATALRVSKSIGVQGCDGRVGEIPVYRIGNCWYYPSAQIVDPSREDIEREEILKENQKQLEKKKEVLQKMKEAGFSDEEIEIMKSKN